MRVIITGAGTVGRAFMRYFLSKGEEVVMVDVNEWALAELKDLARENKNLTLILDDCIKAPEGDLLIHTSAYKHVDLCEDNIESSYKNNVLKTKYLFVINRTKNKIFISTDKAVEPISEYGKQKEEAEKIARGWGGVIVRMGNVLGSSGSIYPIWEKQIEEGKPLTITDWEMKRYFIDADEAIEKIMSLYPKAKIGDTIIPEMGEEVTLGDIVQKILDKKGLKDYPAEIIGIKKGEKLSEKLTWDSETKIYSDNFGSIWR
jgi:FlaA1/EpsC-like NDP-sugar epimerase